MATMANIMLYLKERGGGELHIELQPLIGFSCWHRTTEWLHAKIKRGQIETFITNSSWGSEPQ